MSDILKDLDETIRLASHAEEIQSDIKSRGGRVPFNDIPWQNPTRVKAMAKALRVSIEFLKAHDEWGDAAEALEAVTAILEGEGE